uniref:Uncharacterized protein n=1 Tax=Anguilla anguilla TaxID=7936 RepID=A0A0E9XI80_ANGAN
MISTLQITFDLTYFPFHTQSLHIH